MPSPQSLRERIVTQVVDQMDQSRVDEMSGPTRLLYVTDSVFMGSDTSCEMQLLADFDPQQFVIDAVTLPKGPTARSAAGLPGIRHHPVQLGTPAWVAAPKPSERVWGKLSGMAMFMLNLPRVARIAHRSKAQVVLTGDRTRAMIAALLAARIARAALVYHPGSLFSTDYRNAWLKRRVATYATLVIVNSEFSRRSYLKAGIAADKVVVAYNGIDTERFSPGPSESVRARYGIAEGQPLIGMFSHLREYKGHDIVLQAMLKVLKAVPSAHIVFVGPGPLRAHLEELTKTLGLQKHVTFTGHQKDTVPLYRAVDLFVMASDEEPFGLVTVEAMACEKAVVATRSGGTPEIVEDGVTGLLVPPRQIESLADAIISLLDDPARRQAMGERGRQVVLEKFTVQQRSACVAGDLRKLQRP